MPVKADRTRPKRNKAAEIASAAEKTKKKRGNTPYHIQYNKGRSISQEFIVQSGQNLHLVQIWRERFGQHPILRKGGPNAIL